MNQVEGDHINARNPKDKKAKPGSNSFKNLQLGTKKENLKKSNKWKYLKPSNEVSFLNSRSNAFCGCRPVPTRGTFSELVTFV